jgi:hypothetical protein
MRIVRSRGGWQMIKIGAKGQYACFIYTVSMPHLCCIYASGTKDQRRMKGRKGENIPVEQPVYDQLDEGLV